MKILIRRQWNDFQIAETDFENLESLHWDNISGGVQRRAPQPFIHGYVFCNLIDGEFGHSCMHGDGPHKIKVCITKKGNESVWSQILEIAGPKPKK